MPIVILFGVCYTDPIPCFKVVRLIRKKVINEVNTLLPDKPLSGVEKAFAIDKGIKETKKNYYNVGKPRLPAPIFSKKRHENETRISFLMRRKACNKRRRQREGK